jgi:ferric-dicitrate binding protein FerR (iron transport regulator)
LGQITTQGAAEVNNVAAVTGATVFSGDRITTGTGSTALLSLTAGRQAVLSESSSLRLTRGANEITTALDQGNAAILSPANNPVAMDVGGTRIIPGRAGSVYAVQLSGNKLTVAASRGSVTVEGTNRTVEVDEGNTLEATLATAQDNGAGVGAPVPVVRSRLETVIIIAVIALAATTLALLIRDLNTGCKVVSPSSLGKCEVTH